MQLRHRRCLLELTNICGATASCLGLSKSVRCIFSCIPCASCYFPFSDSASKFFPPSPTSKTSQSCMSGFPVDSFTIQTLPRHSNSALVFTVSIDSHVTLRQFPASSPPTLQSTTALPLLSLEDWPRIATTLQESDSFRKTIIYGGLVA